MLTTCPECALQVSDKAVFCPHCGYPLQNRANIPAPRRSKSKHRKLPNGFGRITKINRDLKNPYRAMITVGRDEKGRPIGKLLKPKAYFPTYNDAYAALLEYNRNPFDLNTDMTMDELYKKWFESVKDSVSRSTAIGYTSTWRYCESTYKLKVRDIRVHHIRYCVERGSCVKNGVVKAASPNMQVRIKLLWNMLMTYAMEYELISTNPAKAFSMPKSVTKNVKTEHEHIRFTDKEMKILWENAESIPLVKAILIQCYMGWRPRELVLIELNNVDLENWTIRGGLKTDAGTNRVVPIHSAIHPFVTDLCKQARSQGSQYMVTASGHSSLSYEKYRLMFLEIMERLKLDPNHKPHDPRKFFVSICKDSGVNEYAIKRMVGHSISDITEKIYTEHNPNWLADEVEKIKAPV